MISFRTDWFDLAVQGTQESSPAPQFESINSLVLSLLYASMFTSLHDYWKNHSSDYTDFVGKVTSLFFNMLFRFVKIPLYRSDYKLSEAHWNLAQDWNRTENTRVLQV